MASSVMLTPNLSADNTVDEAIDQARRAHAAGVRRVWVAQRVDIDAIGLAGLVGAAVPGLGVGTAVVPINPRHPLLISSAAQTAQAASHGNFSLGLGLGAPAVERAAFGNALPNTITRLREHLTVLRSIFDDGAVDFRGEEISTSPQWPVTVPGGGAIPIYVAAMGPKALQVTGELADGTLPYLAGPRTVGEFIAPTIGRAAAEAGRAEPAIIAMVPVVVTDDVEAGKAWAAEQLAFYGTIPSYQKVVAREGVDSVADLAVVGSEAEVRRALQRYLDAGATDVVLSPLRTEPGDAEASWAVAASL
ncbi:TIGR03564 family F420-dependent LLM class oxidoreductase [Mycolicibacterium mengxianglii]|uniref:TIGR03564 family F420-dependent LLM class oxidoreductase n=1 Tax=Mycolicibacterium mengxianglii TaxID=2736649 RepID=UPI0018D1CD3A|nr:TIGR03564 family F420-dependent LLM class oxidoreductase [Mycolicibacterium mengxianglii]